MSIERWTRRRRQRICALWSCILAAAALAWGLFYGGASSPAALLGRAEEDDVRRTPPLVVQAANISTPGAPLATALPYTALPTALPRTSVPPSIPLVRLDGCVDVDVAAPSAFILIAFLRRNVDDASLSSAISLPAASLRAHAIDVLVGILVEEDAWDPEPSLPASPAELSQLADNDPAQFEALLLWYALCAAQRFALSRPAQARGERALRALGGSRNAPQWLAHARDDLMAASGKDLSELGSTAAARESLYSSFAERDAGVRTLTLARTAALSALHAHAPLAAWVATASRAALARAAAPADLFATFLETSARRDGRGASGLEELSAAAMRDSVISELAPALSVETAALQRFTEQQLAHFIELICLPPMERLLVAHGAWSTAAHRVVATVPSIVLRRATEAAAEACLAEELELPVDVIHSLHQSVKDEIATERSRDLFIGMLMPALDTNPNSESQRAPGAALAALAAVTSDGALPSPVAIYTALCTHQHIDAAQVCPVAGLTPEEVDAVKNAAISTLSDMLRVHASRLQAMRESDLAALALWFTMEPAQQLLFVHRRFDPRASKDTAATAWSTTLMRASQLLFELEERRTSSSAKASMHRTTRSAFLAHIAPGDVYAALLELGDGGSPSFAAIPVWSRAEEGKSATTDGSATTGGVIRAVLHGRVVRCDGIVPASRQLEADAKRKRSARGVLLHFAQRSDEDNVETVDLRNSAIAAIESRDEVIPGGLFGGRSPSDWSIIELAKWSQWCFLTPLQRFLARSKAYDAYGANASAHMARLEMRRLAIPLLSKELKVEEAILDALPTAVLAQTAEIAPGSSSVVSVVDALWTSPFDGVVLRRSNVFGASATLLATLRTFLILFGASVQPLEKNGTSVLKEYRDTAIAIMAKLTLVDAAHLHACDNVCLRQLIQLEMLEPMERFLFSRFKFDPNARHDELYIEEGEVSEKIRSATIATLGILLNRTEADLAQLPTLWLRVLALDKTADRVIVGENDIEEASDELIARFVASYTGEDDARGWESARLYEKGIDIMSKVTQKAPEELRLLSVEEFALMAEKNTNWDKAS